VTGEARRVLRWLPLAGLVTAAAANAAWIAKAPLQQARQEVAVAELDGHIYVIGGLVGFEVVGTVEVYDPASDSWSFAEPLPVPLHHVAAASVGGILYVMGGWSDFFATERAELYSYDPVEDAWSPKAPMPVARAGLAAAGLDGRLYAAGGFPPERERDLTVYDPAQNAWGELAPMPTGRNHLGVVALGSLLYVVGGRSGSIGPEENTGALEVFDPVAGDWSPLPPMPTPRSGAATAVFENQVFVFGGEGNPEDPNGIFDDTEAYDPEANEWQALAPMPTGRHGFGAAVLPDGVHLPGGATVAGFGVSDVHEVFVPEPEGALAAGAGLVGLRLCRRARYGTTPGTSLRTKRQRTSNGYFGGSSFGVRLPCASSHQANAPSRRWPARKKADHWFGGVSSSSGGISITSSGS